MTTNPNVQALCNPPGGGGYRSYGSLVRERLIYGRFYAGWSVTQGRYSYQCMYSPAFNTDRHSSHRMVIGYEMVENTYARYHNYRQAQTPEGAWVIRVYLDGTALFRPYKISSLRYNARYGITDMMDFFFYKEAEIQEGRYNRIHVLRRKHLNPQFITPTDAGFGEFLQHKYNK